MPWYWTDDMAAVLVGVGRLSQAEADAVSGAPQAIRRFEPGLVEAAAASQEDGEIPLAV